MSYVLVSQKERENAPFDMFGDMVKLKIADLDKIVESIRKERMKDGQSMQIEIKAIKTRREKEISKVVKFAKDPLTGIYYGIVVGKYDDGNPKFRGILLTDHNTLDLSNDNEAKMYAVLRMHPCVLGNPVGGLEPTFEVVDQDKIAKEKMRKGIDLKKALDIIVAMRGTDVLPFARYLGLPIPTNPTVKILKGSIMDMAIDNPLEFDRKYNEPLRKTYELLATAKATKVVTYDVERGHYLGSLPLGYSVPEVVRTLEQDLTLAARIQSELKNVPKKLIELEDEEEEKKEVEKEIKEVFKNNYKEEQAQAKIPPKEEEQSEEKDPVNKEEK